MLRRIVQSLRKIKFIMPSHTKETPRVEDELHKIISGRVEKSPKETNDVNKTPKEKQDRKPVVRKYAMLLAYQGKNYFGMQIQKDQNTIEGMIFNALEKCGFITEQQKNDPYSFFFQRAARTDKAVSAVRQTCSMFLPRDLNVNVDGHLKMNDNLPPDIRIFGFRVATRNFHCQKDCSSRTYSYTVPSYTFAPLDELTKEDYRISEERLKEINDILNIYKGTHNFFNYTSKRDSGDRSCFRFIIDFYAGKPFIYKDSLHEKEHEFLTIFIHGQSFMLHQIRKMIGMCIAVLRGHTFKSDIQRSFEPIRMDIPKAPGLGLVLEKVHYTNYDKKWGKSHPTLDDWGEEVEKSIESVKIDLVYKEILDTECFKFNMMQWLADMSKHSFTENPTSEEGVNRELSGIHMANKLLKNIQEETERKTAEPNVQVNEEVSGKKEIPVKEETSAH
uniref:Pseudouridylate synthase 1 homolog n=1 Tax=Strongyloides venezuelensis TaxID=75913 RepID=A0A0K0F3U0_STRVS